MWQAAAGASRTSQGRTLGSAGSVAGGCVCMCVCVYCPLYNYRHATLNNHTPSGPRRRCVRTSGGDTACNASNQAEQVVVAEILPWAGRHVTTSPRPPPTLQQHGPTHLYESRCNARQSGTHAHPNATCGFSADVTVHACKSALQSRGYLSRKPAISPALGRFSCRPILCCTGGPIALHSCG